MSQERDTQGIEPQDVYADYAVSRAFSLAATILDAGPYGLTKQQIRQRVEHYRTEDVQSRTAWERLFSRDKAILRESGIRLREPAASAEASGEDYRYIIDPADYGVPSLELTAAELIVLQQAQQVWGGLRAQAALQQAVWALQRASPGPEAGSGSATEPSAGAARLTVGTDADLAQLEHIAAVGTRRPAVFSYIGRGHHAPQRRRVVILGTGVRGHWYLVAHDLDRQGLRTFRIDRIHAAVTPMGAAERSAADDRDGRAIADIAEGRMYRDLAISEVLADRGPEEAPWRALRGVIEAHLDPPQPPRLRPPRPTAPKEPAPQRVERSLAMAAFILSCEGVRPSRLLEHFQLTPRQLLRDLLSIQQAGTFGPEQFGEFIDVVPAPPLNLQAFEAEYLPADPLIVLQLHGDQSSRLMSRPVSLTTPGALSLLIALEGLLGSPDPQDRQLAPAAESLRAKLSGIVPAHLRDWSRELAIAWEVDDIGGRHRQLREALRGGYAIDLDYTDAAGRRSRRVVEPAGILYNGPRTYLRAWCRNERAERNFLLGRIESLTPLPDDPIGEQAAALAREPAAPPRVPDTEGSITAVLRFAPSAARLAEDYSPQRQYTAPDGARTVQTHFADEEALIRLGLEGGGDVVVLRPERARTEILRRARERLDPERLDLQRPDRERVGPERPDRERG